MSNDDQNHRERVIKMVEDAATRIQEHVDTIQVFVTFHAEDGKTTSSFEFGYGNFYARQGQVDEWLRIQHQYQRNEAIRRDQDEYDEPNDTP